MMKRPVLRYELIGIVFIVILGSMLHFAFEWAGKWTPIAVIAAVNESVWEHLKLGFWPALFYTIFGYKYLRKSTNNFLFAKTIGICLIPITITVLFYSYTALLGHDMLILDISIFVIAVIIGQLVSYKLLTSRRLPEHWNKISLIALIILCLAFILFTFYALHLPIFRDPVTGGYGIVR